MDSDRIEGAGRKIAGDAKTAAGRALGDAKLEAEGRTDQARGRAQNFWGGLKDALFGRDRRN